MRTFQTRLLLATLPLLAACGVVGEERAMYFHKDMQRLTHTDWAQTAGDVTGFNDLFPSPKKQEEQAEAKICLHGNSQNRVITQNGVEDRVEYRRCPLAPYAMDGGSRLANRPDEQGSVVR